MTDVRFSSLFLLVNGMFIVVSEGCLATVMFARGDAFVGAACSLVAVLSAVQLPYWFSRVRRQQ